MTRRTQDNYPTPHSIINVLLSRLNWPAGDVWEPCAGDGRLAEAMTNRGKDVISHDIATGNDFFDFKKAEAPTLITNPPFGLMRKFIDHAFAIGIERMALVCNERLWACNKGYEQWNRHRPSRLINLTWREDFLGKGGAPDLGHAPRKELRL
jgi:predicted RNA methylase